MHLDLVAISCHNRFRKQGNILRKRLLGNYRYEDIQHEVIVMLNRHVNNAIRMRLFTLKQRIFVI